MKKWLQKHFSFLQPLIVCVLGTSVFAGLASATRCMIFTILFLDMIANFIFFCIDLEIDGKYFWED